MIAKSPLGGRGPLSLGGVTLSEVTLARMTSVAAFAGQQKVLDRALKPLGLGFPAPNRFTTADTARLVWTGRDQAFLIGGDAAALAPCAALTDQSDGWACLRLDGPEAESVLARSLPLDLRITRFGVGHAARVPFNHMSSVLMRMAPQTFDMLVFRSMARTAWHELEEAMRALAARVAQV